jgi:choline dehydrogenase
MAGANTYDYIVIGAGSAGCVLANRLSADPSRSVLLLEAGGKDRHPLVRLPMLMGKLMHSGIYNWRYDTEPEPELDNREVLPYFRKSESHAERRDDFHGGDGPLSVCRARGTNPLFDRFVEAGVQAGYARNDDFNGTSQDGFGRYDFTIRGRLRSTMCAATRTIAHTPPTRSCSRLGPSVRRRF